MLIDLYNQVFDNNGDIKNCGREACQALIVACNELEPLTNFGDVRTGFMDIGNIKRIVGSIK
jgi:hypothetical protein